MGTDGEGHLEKEIQAWATGGIHAQNTVEKETWCTMLDHLEGD